ncbi:hypothetical protein BSL78_26593, partial [Apostichopus japonicus]
MLLCRYMFQNDLTSITGNPFESKVLKQLHIYLNKISQIEDRSLMGIPNKTTVYLSCDFLLVLPKNSKHDKIKCASASTAPSISAGGSLDIGVALGKDGFNCTLYDYDFNCSPCGIGTYGDTITGGCHSCPIAKKLYVIMRFSPVIRMSLRSHFQNLETRLFACVVVLLFVIYPPVCSVIFSLYPMACKPFYLNQDQTYNITRLRSDLDVDCTSLQVYHIFAFILTVIYVIAFPAALLYLLCKNLYWLPRKADSLTEDLSHENTDESHDSLIANDSQKYPSPPTWLNFLCENYKKEFWFWEIVELARKVTQTLLITLFGWEDRLTVIITTCISVLFLLLHARYRPMKSSYEQGLQMFSLTVIFINVIVAANEFPNEEEVPLSVLLVLLNIIVLVIIG